MTRAFLVRGMLVGILAGLLTFGFLKVYGEPQVDRAIAFESAAAQGLPPATIFATLPSPSLTRSRRVERPRALRDAIDH